MLFLILAQNVLQVNVCAIKKAEEARIKYKVPGMEKSDEKIKISTIFVDFCRWIIYDHNGENRQKCADNCKGVSE